jgi:pimeloyl-ACP methyl ester carboxylesterase
MNPIHWTRYFLACDNGVQLAIYRFKHDSNVKDSVDVESSAADLNKRPVVLLAAGCGNKVAVYSIGGNPLPHYLSSNSLDVWAFDFRGHGASTQPIGTTWSLDSYVFEDALAVINYICSVTMKESVHWIGHSMGGIIGMMLSCHPETSRLLKSVNTLGSSIFLRNSFWWWALYFTPAYPAVYVAGGIDMISHARNSSCFLQIPCFNFGITDSLLANTENDGIHNITRLLNEMFCFEPRGVIDALADGMQEHGLSLNKSIFDNNTYDSEKIIDINDVNDDKKKKHKRNVSIEYSYSDCIDNDIGVNHKHNRKNETIIVTLEKDSIEVKKTQGNILFEEKKIMNLEIEMQESSEKNENFVKCSNTENEKKIKNENEKKEENCMNFSEFYAKYLDFEKSDNEKNDNEKKDEIVYTKDIIGCHHSCFLLICATEDIIVTESDIISTYESIVGNSTSINAFSNEEKNSNLIKKNQNCQSVNVESITTHCNSSKLISIGKKAGHRLSYGHYDLLFGEDAAIDVFPEILDFILNVEMNQHANGP